MQNKSQHVVANNSQSGTATLTDEAAITALKQGRVEGLTSLVERYQVQAVHTALLILQDPAAAEDVVQNAYLKAYGKIAGFDSRRPFKPWFFRIVINDAIKAAKRASRMLSLESLEDSRNRKMADWLIDPQTGLEEALEHSEVHECVWQALSLLSPEQRVAVVMKYYLDKSEKEMIVDLGKPLTTIKWWLFSARRQLKTILADWAGQGDSDRRMGQEIYHE